MTELNHDNKNRRILVIDDIRSIHDDFRKIFAADTNATEALDASEEELFGSPKNVGSQTQFEVDSAYQGQDGVLMIEKALAAGRPYALAFVDVRMPPGLDGVETTQKIWAVDPDVQIVICTAYSDYSWNEMFAKIGNCDGLVILKKPFDTAEALQLAHTLTEKWWLHRQSQRKMEELEGWVAERTQELTRSLSLLNATLESTTDGIVAVDLSGKIVSYNTKFADTWRFPAGMLARRDAAETRAYSAGQIKDPAVFIERTKELQASPEVEQFDVIELKDGRIFERYIFPQRINDECVGAVINWRDITKRRQAETEMQWKTAFLEAQVNSSIDGILVVDEHGKKSIQNQRVAELFKIPPAIANDSDDAAQVKWVTDAVKNPKEFGEKIAYLYSHPDEVSRDEVELNDGTSLDRYSAPVIGLDGKYYGRIWTFRDMTARKKIEAQLVQSQKMETVGKLAGGIAHEFNSILTAIIGQSELLHDDLPADSPLIHSATEITKAASRAATLTRQLLAYGRKQFLQTETLDFNRVVAGMESVLHNLMGGDVELQIVPDPGLQAVKADAGQIEQVIMNMAINARDAMPNGGKLLLETANVSFDAESVGRYPELNPGNYVMLAITDTGTGMNEAVRARVFEPFFSTKGVGEGTGLGLSTCYGIIKQSGGHISVYSELGRGTTFKIYLPQVEAQAKIPGAHPVATDLPPGTETILLVEDDPALREMAATLLRRLGYTVFAAGNGVEALSLKHAPGTGHIDLLFTDVVMPHMSGKELADRVRALYPHTKILFTSAYTENANVHQGALDKGVALLQKPFTPSALANKVRKILDQKEATAS